MSKLAKALTAAAGNVAGGYEYNYFAFPQAVANGATYYYDNYISVADVSARPTMSMYNYKKLDNGYFNYYMRGLAGDPENHVVFCTSSQGSKIYAVDIENSMNILWSKNVSSVKALTHDHENQILYYITGNNTLTAVDSTDGSSLGTLSTSGLTFTPSNVFNVTLVDDNTRLVIFQSYESSASANCLATFDVSNPASMSLDSQNAVDVYNGDQHGIGWDAESQILWVNGYYDSSVYGLTQSGSGWVKSYTISAGASPFGMTVAKGLDAVIVGTSGELQIWDVSNPSSPSKVYTGTGSERKYALAFDETEKFAYGTRIPSNTSWGIGNWDLSSSISSPTFTQLSNLGTPYTTLNQFRSYNAIVT
jgi:hypothetical protein